MTDYMQEALQLAKCGCGLTSPNPAVGAVLVRDEKIVGRGFHTWAGIEHAEVIALRAARVAVIDLHAMVVREEEAIIGQHAAAVRGALLYAIIRRALHEASHGLHANL